MKTSVPGNTYEWPTIKLNFRIIDRSEISTLIYKKIMNNQKKNSHHKTYRITPSSKSSAGSFRASLRPKRPSGALLWPTRWIIYAGKGLCSTGGEGGGDGMYYACGGIIDAKSVRRRKQRLFTYILLKVYWDARGRGRWEGYKDDIPYSLRGRGSAQFAAGAGAVNFWMLCCIMMTEMVDWFIFSRLNGLMWLPYNKGHQITNQRR